METFKKIYKRASERKGGAKALEILLGQKIIGKKLHTDNAALQSVTALSDDRVLSAFTKQVFKSGFVWHP